MPYFLFFLLLTACGQKTENAKPEAAAKNITNIALTKYGAREELTEEEYLSLRKPVPDWETYKRLVRAEDGFDDLRRFYLATNIIAPNLDWNSIVYYDPKNESYYHGVFKPTNMDGLNTLIQSKKNPTQEVYGRNRVVLITNISPSLHIYADAYNDYKLYTLDLTATIDEYGAWLNRDENGNSYSSYLIISHGTYEELDNSARFYQYTTAPYEHGVKWRALTNRTLFRPIEYYPITNGVSVHLITESPILEKDLVLAELTNTNKNPTKDYFGDPLDLIYTEENKEIYYLFKYDFYGDIAELTNENPPMRTNVGERFEESDIPNAFTRNKIGALIIYEF